MMGKDFNIIRHNDDDDFSIPLDGTTIGREF